MTVFSYAGREPTYVRGPFRNNDNVAALVSPFTGASQFVVRDGGLWQYKVGWSNLTDSERKVLLAFFEQLNGMEHVARLELWADAPQGTWSGTPEVDGASQTGTTLNIKSGGGVVTDYAKAGDFISFSAGGVRELHRVTADADTDSGGLAALSIQPAIRTSPADSATIQKAAVKADFKLVSPIDYVLDARRRTGVADFGSSKNQLMDLELDFVEHLPS